MIAVRIVQTALLQPIETNIEPNIPAAHTAARNLIAAMPMRAAIIAVRRSRRDHSHTPGARSRAGRKSAEILCRCC